MPCNSLTMKVKVNTLQLIYPVEKVTLSFRENCVFVANSSIK